MTHHLQKGQDTQRRGRSWSSDAVEGIRPSPSSHVLQVKSPKPLPCVWKKVRNGPSTPKGPHATKDPFLAFEGPAAWGAGLSLLSTGLGAGAGDAQHRADQGPTGEPQALLRVGCACARFFFARGMRCSAAAGWCSGVPLSFFLSL